MNFNLLVFWFLGFVELCRGQRRPVINRPNRESSYSPCSGDYDSYDSVDDGRSVNSNGCRPSSRYSLDGSEDGVDTWNFTSRGIREERHESCGMLVPRTLVLAAAGGAALGYHLANKNQQQPLTINNNIHNDYPSPCVVVQGGGGGGGGIGGGGIIGGILSHHPILSNVLQGGWLQGGNGGSGFSNNRQNNINWNRAIRQFSRIVRPITRGFR